MRHAAGFGWSGTVDRLLEVYTGAKAESTTKVPL
jgi:hypothetical protein